MPELPEVEIARRQLAHWSSSSPVVDLEITDPAVVRTKLSTRPSDADPQALRAAVDAVRLGCDTTPIRHGKRIGWIFGEIGILIHLGMTGQFVRRAAGETPRFGRAVFRREDGVGIWFCDARRFGGFAVVPAGEVQAALRAGHGPDALLEPQNGQELAERFQTKKAIKVALLDQHRITGMGNIHAAEALFLCGIDPTRPAQSLSVTEWDALAEAIPRQLRSVIVDEGLDEMVYVTQGGDNPFKVYGRSGELCVRCDGTIVSAKHGGRSTFWCPGCQQ